MRDNNIKFLIYIIYVPILVIALICLPASASEKDTAISQEVSKSSDLKFTPEEKQWLKDNPVVRARVGAAPPLHFFEDSVKGISVDYLNLIASHAGFQVKYVTGVPWSKALDLIKKHEKIDLLLTAKITEERKNFLSFTDNYLFMPWVIFTRDKIGFIGGIEDLAGKIVSVERGYVMHQKLMAKFPDISLLVTETSKDAIEAVATGKADAHIGNLTITTYIIQQNNLNNVKIAAPTPFDNHNQAMAIRDDWPQLASIINKTFKSLSQDEHEQIRHRWLAVRYEYGISKQDVIKWILVTCAFSITIIGIIMFWNRKLQKEILERKKSEKLLADSEVKFKKMFERAPLSYQSLDGNGNFLEVNSTWLDVLGYTKEEVIGENFGDFLHPDWKGHFKENFPRFKAVGEVLGVEFEMIKKNGSPILVSFHGKIGRDKNGKFQQTHCIFQDITTSRMLQEESEKNKTILLEAEKLARFGGWQWDIETDIWTLSENWLNIHGVTNPFLTTDELLKIVHQNDVQKIQNALKGVIEKGRIYDIEHQIVDQTTGELKYIHAVGDARRDESGKVSKVYGAAQDITERKHLEERVLQAQKMESIGNLAGGIAHDFNNILYPIVGMSEMLMEDLPKDSTEHENAGEIFKAGLRGSDLVKQILSFSRQDEHKVLPVRFQQVLKEVLKLSRSTIPVNIELMASIQNDCGLILADPTQLHQVAMNLITNAYHAVGQTDGKIEIVLEEVDIKTDSHLSLPSGRYALLKVSDDGIGIPSHLIDKVFEPYFTTKEKGRGTGLGLSVVFGIIKEHNGDIRVHSDVGKGTVFSVYLPLMEKSDEGFVDEKIEIAQSGNERILLVDDEKSVAQLEAQMLERLGYKVTSQTDSLAALKIFQSDPFAFDLVITDMTMPHMTGDKLAQILLTIRAEIPIIVCTGFSEKMNKERAEHYGIKGLLMKPVMKSDLAKTVRKVLDENLI